MSPVRRHSLKAIHVLATVAVAVSATQCKRPEGHNRTNTIDVVVAIGPAPRPNNVLATAHFGSPRSAARRVSTLVGRAIPLELGLSLVLGFESALVAAIDAEKAMDAVMLAAEPSEKYLMVFTPAGGSSMRSTLGTRYRFTRVEGLGELLEPRQPSTSNEPQWRCAIVGVGGESGSRIVCSRDEGALRDAGRWAAENARAQEQDSSDLVATISGDSFRELLLPTIERSVHGWIEGLSASARRERQNHDGPPDLGDPEALVRQLDGLAANIRIIGPDLRQITVHAAVGTEDLTIDGTLEYPANSQATLALDARSRVGIATTHNLLGRLNPASWFAVGANATDGYFQRFSTNVLTIAMSVLGSRVARATEMQADWTELFSHLGNETAFGCSNVAEPAAAPRRGQARPVVSAPMSLFPTVECTALFAQSDEGVAARAVIARLGRAPWLREMRFGTAAPIITTQNNAVIMRLPPPPPSQPQVALSTGERARAASPPAIRELALTVNRGQLAVLYGPNVRAQLRTLDAQTAGAGPNVSNGLVAPIVLGVDARMGRATELMPTTLTLDSREIEGSLRTSLRVRIPGALMTRGASRGL